MRCPECGRRTKVVSGVDIETVHWRQHRCPKCGWTFHTSEMEDEPYESISAMKQRAEQVQGAPEDGER